MTAQEKKRLLERLQRLCSRAEYCSSDIYRKALRASDGDADSAAEILEDLVKDGFVDDSRYAEAFAREKSAITGWGPIKIRMALSAKGIRGEAADRALEAVDAKKGEEKLRRMLETKWRVLSDDPQGRLKLIKFGLSRGYDYDELKALIEQLIQKRDQDQER